MLLLRRTAALRVWCEPHHWSTRAADGSGLRSVSSVNQASMLKSCNVLQLKPIMKSSKGFIFAYSSCKGLNFLVLAVLNLISAMKMYLALHGVNQTTWSAEFIFLKVFPFSRFEFDRCHFDFCFVFDLYNIVLEFFSLPIWLHFLTD